MADEWREVPISKVATPVIGGTPSRSVAEYWHGDIPWATAKDIAAVSGRYLNHVEEFITQEGLENSAAKLLPKGTVVITARGTVGALAQLGRPMAFNQTCYALLPTGELDNEFLFYALKGTIDEMRALTYGTVFETITTQTFDHWLIPIPPLSEQRAIARILGALDDKIEINRRQSATLEAMARALFQAWFVDFKPVRAKCRGDLDGRPRWQRGQSLPGLPADLYDLFPDRLVDSELGPIPEGWEISPLDGIANYLNGIAWQKYKASLGEPSLPVIKIRELRDGRTSDTSDRASLNVSSEYWIDNGDVIFSWSGSLLVKVWCGGQGILNQHLFKVTSDAFPKWFYYWWTQEHLERFQRIAADKATTMGHIKREHLHEAKVLIPSDSLLQKMSEIMMPLLEQYVILLMQANNLAALRDALLPKLISGELRVPDAEAFLQETDVVL